MNQHTNSIQTRTKTGKRERDREREKESKREKERERERVSQYWKKNTTFGTPIIFSPTVFALPLLYYSET